jgi:CRISPR-associated protein Csm2
MVPFNYKNFNSKWIKEKITAESGDAYIDYLSGFGFFLCDKKDETDRFPGYGSVTTSQLRNIFSEVKRIEVRLDVPDSGWQSDLIMLRPKIAYNTARTLQRTRNSRMKELREVLEKALGEVKTEEDFLRFSKFFEGIIAYHKVYGGKD